MTRRARRASDLRGKQFAQEAPFDVVTRRFLRGERWTLNALIAIAAGLAFVGMPSYFASALMELFTGRALHGGLSPRSIGNLGLGAYLIWLPIYLARHVWRKRDSLRRASIHVNRTGIYEGRRLLVPRRGMRRVYVFTASSGHCEPQVEVVILGFLERLNEVRLGVVSELEGHRLVAALGFGEGHPLRLNLRHRPSEFLYFLTSFLLLGFEVIGGSPSLSRLLSIYLISSMFFIAVLTDFWFSAERTVTAGSDGLLIRNARKDEFVPYAAIESVRVADHKMVLTSEDRGQRRVHSLYLKACGGLVADRQNLLRTAIERGKATAAAHNPSLEVPATPQDHSYRIAAVPVDHLLSVVADGTADIRVRVAAAKALVQQNGGVGHGRDSQIARIAESTALPELQEELPLCCRPDERACDD